MTMIVLQGKSYFNGGMAMNIYDIDGITYEAFNEYEATKKAFKSAKSISLVKYLGEDKWNYNIEFPHGKATVLVVRTYPIR